MNAHAVSDVTLLRTLAAFERHGYKAATACFLREMLEAEIAASAVSCHSSAPDVTLGHDEDERDVHDPARTSGIRR